MRGDAENDYHGEWSESDVEFSPFARQLTITKAKKLIRRHTKKFRSRGQKNSGSSMFQYIHFVYYRNDLFKLNMVPEKGLHLHISYFVVV